MQFEVLDLRDSKRIEDMQRRAEIWSKNVAKAFSLAGTQLIILLGSFLFSSLPAAGHARRDGGSDNENEFVFFCDSRRLLLSYDEIHEKINEVISCQRQLDKSRLFSRYSFLVNLKAILREPSENLSSLGICIKYLCS